MPLVSIGQRLHREHSDVEFADRSRGDSDRPDTTPEATAQSRTWRWRSGRRTPSTARCRLHETRYTCGRSRTSTMTPAACRRRRRRCSTTTGEVVRVVHGPVPLWGSRRGEDVMMTDALAFDVRVYDPGAPLFGVREDLTDATSNVDVIVEPSDPGWIDAYTHHSDNMAPATGIGIGGTAVSVRRAGGVRRHGLRLRSLDLPLAAISRRYAPSVCNSSAASPWFFEPRALARRVRQSTCARATLCTTRGRSTTRTTA